MKHRRQLRADGQALGRAPSRSTPTPRSSRARGRGTPRRRSRRQPPRRLVPRLLQSGPSPTQHIEPFPASFRATSPTCRAAHAPTAQVRRTRSPKTPIQGSALDMTQATMVIGSTRPNTHARCTSTSGIVRCQKRRTQTARPPSMTMAGNGGTQAPMPRPDGAQLSGAQRAGPTAPVIRAPTLPIGLPNP